MFPVNSARSLLFCGEHSGTTLRLLCSQEHKECIKAKKYLVRGIFPPSHGDISEAKSYSLIILIIVSSMCVGMLC